MKKAFSAALVILSLCCFVFADDEPNQTLNVVTVTNSNGLYLQIGTQNFEYIYRTSFDATNGYNILKCLQAQALFARTEGKAVTMRWLGNEGTARILTGITIKP